MRPLVLICRQEIMDYALCTSATVGILMGYMAFHVLQLGSLVRHVEGYIQH